MIYATAPTELIVHGDVTVDGQKISRSLGNVIDPVELVRRFGTDALRYFLLRHVHTDPDGDLTEARVAAARQGELAAGLGNLVRTVSTLIERDFDGWVDLTNDTREARLVVSTRPRARCRVSIGR